MAEDLHKDNLEDFFKDAFEESADLAATEGWDVPSDQVWEKVAQAIHPADGIDKGFIWWKYWGIGVLVLLFVIAGVFYFSYDKKENGGQEIIPVEDRVLNQNTDQDLTTQSLVEQNTTEKESANPQNENLNSNNETVAEEEDKTSSVYSNNDKKDATEKSLKVKDSASKEGATNAKKDSPSPNDISDKSATAFEKNATLNNSLEKENSIAASVKDNEPKTATSKSATKPKDIAVVPEEKQSSLTSDLDEGKDNKLSSRNDMDSTIANPVVPFETLQPLPTKTLFAEIQSTTPDTLALLQTPFTDLEKKPKDTKPSKGFYAGISLAPTYTDRQIKIVGNPVIPRDLKRNEKGQFSYSIGLNLGYKFSKNWSLETGFNYSTLTLRHNARKQVRYSALGERMNDRGEFERDYSFGFSTSSGEVGTDIALARAADSPIAENEFITLQLKAKQNIQYGNIPIIARYQLGKGKLQAGLKVGLVNRFVLDGALRIEEVRIARNDFRLVVDDRVYRSRPLKNIKKYEADFLIGAGISYHFNEKMWLAMEPTFTRSINPLFETQLFKTYPMVTSLDVGFNYLF